MKEQKGPSWAQVFEGLGMATGVATGGSLQQFRLQPESRKQAA